MNAAVLFICDLCGTPVELSARASDQLAQWERRIGTPLVVHCLSCAAPLIREASE